MQTQLQPELARALEPAFGLLARERDAFAEYIRGVGELLRCDCRQHVVAYMTHVVVLSIGKLRRQRVRAEKSLDHIYAEPFAQSLRNAQHLQLAREVEPVAGLH